jgi:tetratricopeptide (TPR) repeat protein
MPLAHRVDKYIELSEWLAFQCRNPELACEWIDRALAEEPENPEALFVKGDILQALERFDVALVCYDRVLELLPEAVDAVAEKAQVLCELGRWEQAIKTADAGIEAISSAAGAEQAADWGATEETLLEAKAHALFELGRTEESIQVLEEGLRRHPGSHLLGTPLSQLRSEATADPD